MQTLFYLQELKIKIKFFHKIINLHLSEVCNHKSAEQQTFASNIILKGFHFGRNVELVIILKSQRGRPFGNYPIKRLVLLNFKVVPMRLFTLLSAIISTKSSS